MIRKEANKGKDSDDRKGVSKAKVCVAESYKANQMFD